MSYKQTSKQTNKQVPSVGTFLEKLDKWWMDRENKNKMGRGGNETAIHKKI